MATTHKASEGPRWCWVCEKQLQWAKGKGKGLFYFVLAEDRQGIERRIHAQEHCKDMAKADGMKVK